MSGKKDWVFRIQDMIDNIEELGCHLSDVTEEEFLQNTFIQKAAERYFEIIGEAARFVPKDIQKKYGHIAWGDIIGMRHKISHDYMDVNARILWQSYKGDFGQLKNHLATLLEEEK